MKDKGCRIHDEGYKTHRIPKENRLMNLLRSLDREIYC